MLNSVLCSILPLIALPLTSVVGIPLAGDAMTRRNYPFVSSAWYAGWHAAKFPLSSISWDKYNTLVYSFAVTDPAVTKLSLSPSDATQLPLFVAEAHKHNVSAHISIGGWGGSDFFTYDVATPENRTALAKTVVDFATNYKLDGINFDWEYPTGANDTHNMVLFLQALRAHPTKLTLTAATHIHPWVDTSGKSTAVVPALASVIDYIQIMSYDLSGSWSPHAGPNAPIDEDCAPAANRGGSVATSVAAWNAAGMPKEKIVVSVAAFGHSFRVKPSDAFVGGKAEAGLAPYPPFNATDTPIGDIWDCADPNTCGGTKHGGLFTLWGLIDGGFLTKELKPAHGISFRYDGCSQTPYVYNATSQVLVSYDDAASFSVKGQFIKYAGLRGFAMWEAGGDYNNTLLNAIRSSL